MSTEHDVTAHYSRGDLEQAILDGLRASGKDIARLAPSDLSGVDEFHLGWHAATVELGRNLAFTRGLHVLDVGSGIGGPARYLAVAHGCRVTGVDLTPEYVEVANSLTRRCGLASKVEFRQASALDLPFPDSAFNGAIMIHVGMNIGDKARLFREVRRVLEPGARFGVYDIMRVAEGDIPYPMPWAATAAASFVETPETYRGLLAAAGFEIESEHDRRELSISLGRKMREEAAKHGSPPLGLHVLMGPEAPARLKNVMSTLERGTIAPIEMVVRAALDPNIKTP